jgi:outer membrane protein assembly factor BamB
VQPAQALRGFLLVKAGAWLLGIDADAGQLLWKREVPTADVEMQLSATAVCLMTRDALEGLDPLTGRTLWRRTGLSASGRLSTDGRHLFVVELNEEGTPTATHAFRLDTGAIVVIKDFLNRLSNQGKLVGGRVLWSEAAPGKKVMLVAYDVLSGKEVWTRSYPVGSRVIESHSQGYLGVLDSDKRVSIVAADRGAEVLGTDLKDAEFEKLKSVYLLADAHLFYVICNESDEFDVLPPGPKVNVEGGIPQRALPVNGLVFAIDRSSTMRAWVRDEKHQMLLLHRFEELPFLLVASRYERRIDRVRSVPMTGVQATDKRTGRLLWDDEMYRSRSTAPFHTLRYDPMSGRIAVQSEERELTFEPKDKK